VDGACRCERGRIRGGHTVDLLRESIGSSRNGHRDSVDPGLPHEGGGWKTSEDIRHERV
jgi:hypothetical protein